MELFKRFDKTIFAKNDSELEKQIKALKKIQLEYPDNEKISQKLKIAELGYQGEKEIEFELKNADIGMYVLHDVNIKYENSTAQIDYIVITSAKIYFIECKNLIGNITVNDRGEFIREYTYNGKNIKEGMYSPIRQAEKHVEIFKKIWDSRHTSILNRIQSKNMDNWCTYLVVMANHKNILNIQNAPKEISKKIVRSDNLVKYLKDEINNTDKAFLSKEKLMKENAVGLLKDYNINIKRDYEEEFRTLIKRDNTDYLKNKLIEFRNITSKENKIPAYYVFNDQELEKLLKYRPKNMEELKDLKILPEIKQKIHGEKIIEIIKNI